MEMEWYIFFVVVKTEKGFMFAQTRFPYCTEDMVLIGHVRHDPAAGTTKKQ